MINKTSSAKGILPQINLSSGEVSFQRNGRLTYGHFSWPALSLWDKCRLPQVRKEIVTIAHAISEFEPVVVWAPEPKAAYARRKLGPKIKVAPIPVVDGNFAEEGTLQAQLEEGAGIVSDKAYEHWRSEDVRRRVMVSHMPFFHFNIAAFFERTKLVIVYYFDSRDLEGKSWINYSNKG